MPANKDQEILEELEKLRQENAQLKASNQPAAQPMGSTPTPPNAGTSGGGLAQYFPRTQATGGALSGHPEPK